MSLFVSKEEALRKWELYRQQQKEKMEKEEEKNYMPELNNYYDQGDFIIPPPSENIIDRFLPPSPKNPLDLKYEDFAKDVENFIKYPINGLYLLPEFVDHLQDIEHEIPENTVCYKGVFIGGYPENDEQLHIKTYSYTDFQDHKLRKYFHDILLQHGNYVVHLIRNVVRLDTILKNGKITKCNLGRWKYEYKYKVEMINSWN